MQPEFKNQAMKVVDKFCTAGDCSWTVLSPIS